MASGKPADDFLFAGHVDGWGIGPGHGESRDLRTIGESCRLDVTDVAVAVFGKIRMKGECVELSGFRNTRLDVDDQVSRFHVRVIGKRKDLPVLLNDEESVAAGRAGQVEAFVEFECWKGALRHVR